MVSVFDQYVAGLLDTNSFDDKIWDKVCSLADDGEGGYDRLPTPVRLYYASRYLEWEVGNGGFAQAAHNIPHLFSAAREGYLSMDLVDAARLIADAEAIMANGGAEFSDTEDIGELFVEFTDSKFAELDQRLDSAGWWATERRVSYVVRNREAFETLG